MMQPAHIISVTSGAFQTTAARKMYTRNVADLSKM